MNPEPTRDQLSTDEVASLSFFSESEQLERLMLRAQEGDPVAIGELLEGYRTYLRTIAQRRMSGQLARRIDPSDLVQQTMLEAHQRLQQLLTVDLGHFRARLRRILTCNVANAIRDHLVAQKRNAEREMGAIDANQLQGNLTSPSMTMAKRESLLQFTTAISQLPEDQATAICMRYFEHASVSEIGEVLGRSRVAAAGLLKRGLAELRNLLSADVL